MTVGRLLLTRTEAAELLGVSLSHFERHIQPHIPCVYTGRLRRYRPRDLERWIDDQVTTRPPEAR
ncbi:MAG TPA: helix-turn-helix domain-containing protein [Solirubrobacterales bacterium]|nr:helix-turn-helix domain-containing protein [Solirubrobacterales bacterium]